MLGPSVMHEQTPKVFIASMLLVASLQLICCMLLHKSNKSIRTELYTVTNLHDLTYICFGDSIVAFQEFIRMLISASFLVCFNIFLGSESVRIMSAYFSNPHI